MIKIFAKRTLKENFEFSWYLYIRSLKQMVFKLSRIKVGVRILYMDVWIRDALRISNAEVITVKLFQVFTKLYKQEPLNINDFHRLLHNIDYQGYQ